MKVLIDNQGKRYQVDRQLKNAESIINNQECEWQEPRSLPDFVLS